MKKNTQKKLEYRYYSIGWHRFAIILKSVILFVVFLMTTPILVKFILKGLTHLEFIVNLNTLEINVLSNFIGSFVGIFIGFIFEATYIYQWKILDQYQSIIQVVNEELNYIITGFCGQDAKKINYKILPSYDYEQYKKIVQDHTSGIGIESVRNVCNSVEYDSVFYSIPRYVFLQNLRIFKGKRGTISIKLHKIESYIVKFNNQMKHFDERQMNEYINTIDELIKQLYYFRQLTYVPKKNGGDDLDD